MADIIQIRRDTAANWTAANPTLADGELGVESGTKRVKVGDGVTAWNSLGYAFEVETDDLTDGLTNAVVTLAQRANYETAYSWGDHAQVGYLTTLVGQTITESQISDLKAYLTGITGESIKSLADVNSTMTPTEGQLLTWNNTTAVWEAANAPVSLPDQTGNAGLYLTTNGTTASWSSVESVPSQTGNAFKVLSTDGTNLTWINAGDDWSKSADSATITYDGQGRVSQLDEMIDTYHRVANYTYDAEGFMTQAVITFKGIQRTETFTNDANGYVQSISVVEVAV